MTGLLEVRPGTIPQPLIERPQWLPWSLQQREGQWTKVPLGRTGWPARWSKPSTWCAFDEARHFQQKLGADGLGFVFTESDPLAGVDLDAQGVQEHAIIQTLDSYTERSPSGRGAHIIVIASKPPNGCRSGHVEMYDRGRFLTITGHVLPVSPSSWTIRERQQELEALHRQLFPPAPLVPLRRLETRPPTDDAALWHRMLACRYGPDIRDLKERSESALSIAYPTLTPGKTFDWSRADLALCKHLAWWTQKDATRIDRMFRQSELYRPKWERDDYAARTIRLALNGR